jgi:MFS family permease
VSKILVTGSTGGLGGQAVEFLLRRVPARNIVALGSDPAKLEPTGVHASVPGLFTSFGNGVLRPALTSEISRSVERYEQGTVLGLNQSLQSVAQILAPLASTFLIGYRLLAPWAWFPAAICMLGLWLCVRMPREAAAQMS